MHHFVFSILICCKKRLQKWCIPTNVCQTFVAPFLKSFLQLIKIVWSFWFWQSFSYFLYTIYYIVYSIQILGNKISFQTRNSFKKSDTSRNNNKVNSLYDRELTNFQFNNLAIFNFDNFGNFQSWYISILITISSDNFQFWLFSSKIFEWGPTKRTTTTALLAKIVKHGKKLPHSSMQLLL